MSLTIVIAHTHACAHADIYKYQHLDQSYKRKFVVNLKSCFPEKQKFKNRNLYTCVRSVVVSGIMRAPSIYEYVLWVVMNENKHVLFTQDEDITEETSLTQVVCVATYACTHVHAYAYTFMQTYTLSCSFTGLY